MFKTAGGPVRSVDGMTAIFNGIGLAVTDMAASLSFYRRLGLDIPASAETEPHAEAELPGGIRLMFDTKGSLGLDDKKDEAKTGPSLAFLCKDATEVDQVYTDLAKAGYVTAQEPWDAVWGQRYAIVKDPDGHQVDLFAWLKD